MNLIISIGIIVLICIAYKLLEWLYSKYNDDLNNIDDHTVSTRVELTKRINELEKRLNMSEQMINWLWENVAQKKQKQEKKGRSDKK